MARLRIRKLRRLRGRQEASAPIEEQSVRTQLGLGADEPCAILIVGSADFCSFIKARLGRLGYSSGIGLTSGPLHAQEAIRAESPQITIIDLNIGVRSGGVDLAATIQNEALKTSVILLARRFDDRSLRDLGYKMNDAWSVVARRATDNGDPLELAMHAVRDGRTWVDPSISSELSRWRMSAGKSLSTDDAQSVS